MTVVAGLLMGAKVDGYATYTFLSSSNVTADTLWSAKVVADYGHLDCYQTLDVASANRVTVSLEHSPDGTNWISDATGTNAGAEADGTIYWAIPISGAYMRARSDLNSSNNVTITIKCIAKDLSQ
jgi:hypothetical protein